MTATTVTSLPTGAGWAFEPKDLMPPPPQKVSADEERERRSFG